MFSLEIVRRSPTLKCPLCGKVFQFRKKQDSGQKLGSGTLPIAASAAASSATPAGPASLPQTAAAEPAGDPIAESGRGEFALEFKPLVRVPRRTYRARKPWIPRLVTAALVLGLLGGLLFIVFRFKEELGWSVMQSGEFQEAKSFNYRFHLPKDWVRDPDEEQGMKGSGLRIRLAMRRTDPASTLAILARDYEKERTLTDGQLMDEGLRSLGKHFQEFEWQQKPDGVLAGKNARRIEFQGDENGVTMKGECLMTTFQGYAFWFVTFSPVAEKDEAEGEWTDIREGFRFLNRRQGWVEKPRKRAAYTSANGAYVLRYPEGLWEKQPLAGYDPATDLVLLGTDPATLEAGMRHDARRAAIFQVLLIPKTDNLKADMAALQKRVLARQKEDGFPDSQMDLAGGDDGPTDQAEDLGEFPGWVAHFRLRNGETRHRFVVLAAAPVGEQLLAIVGECDWQRRSFWQEEFQDLLSHFEKPKAKDKEK